MKRESFFRWAFVGLCAYLGWMAAGCGLQERSSTLEQKQRENVSQSATSDFVQAVKPSPVSITVPQKGADPIVITTPAAAETKAAASVGEESASTASGSGNDSVSFPLFVKIIGLAIGLALLGGLLWLARRSSAAVNAAWTQADDMIASRLKTVSALKGAATEPTKIAALAEEESRLNALRAEAAK